MRDVNDVAENQGNVYDKWTLKEKSKSNNWRRSSLGGVIYGSIVGQEKGLS